MGVAENHPFVGELFQVGQVDLAFGVVDLAVPNTHIIHQENQDIGWGGLQRFSPSEVGTQRQKNKGNAHSLRERSRELHDS
jgi:hypothetical protein